MADAGGAHGPPRHERGPRPIFALVPWVARRFRPTLARPLRYPISALAAVCQVATLLLTWDLWNERPMPPNLPVVDGLSRVNWAPTLLLLAALTLATPRIAAPLFCAFLVLSALGDQTRLQPEVVSLAVLMTAPLYGEEGTRVARWHLTTVWAWSGINKALSLGWSTGGAAFIASSVDLPGQRPLIAVGLPVVEIGVGAASAFRRAWPVVRWAGCLLNLAIFVTLSPVFAASNSAVWPWNIALAGASLLLFSGRQARTRPSAQAVGLIVALTAYPALFYLGLADAYMTHNLYTNNTESATMCSPQLGCTSAPFDTGATLNVPLPPEGRLYRAWFDRRCQPGTALVVTGRRTRVSGPPTVTHYACARG